MKKILAPLLMTLVLFSISGQVKAVLVSFEYNDTISATNIAGLSAGQTATITVWLDNGGPDGISQTWFAADLQSITFDFNNGGLVTTFSSPFDGGLVTETGNFATDATGTPTSVMSSWTDPFVAADYSTNGSATFFGWLLDGKNPLYFDGSSDASLTNVASILDPASWSDAMVVPLPATLWLLISGLGMLGWTRRNRLASIWPARLGRTPGF